MLQNIISKPKKHKTLSRIIAENVGWSTTLLQCFFPAFWTAEQRTLRFGQQLKIGYPPFATLLNSHDLQYHILLHQKAESSFFLLFPLNLFHTKALTGLQLSCGFAPSYTSCWLDQQRSPPYIHMSTQGYSTLSIYLKLNFYPTVVCVSGNRVI